MQMMGLADPFVPLGREPINTFDMISDGTASMGLDVGKVFKKQFIKFLNIRLVSELT